MVLIDILPLFLIVMNDHTFVPVYGTCRRWCILVCIFYLEWKSIGLAKRVGHKRCREGAVNMAFKTPATTRATSLTFLRPKAWSSKHNDEQCDHQQLHEPSPSRLAGCTLSLYQRPKQRYLQFDQWLRTVTETDWAFIHSCHLTNVNSKSWAELHETRPKERTCTQVGNTVKVEVDKLLHCDLTSKARNNFKTRSVSQQEFLWGSDQELLAWKT